MEQLRDELAELAQRYVFTDPQDLVGRPVYVGNREVGRIIAVEDGVATVQITVVDAGARRPLEDR